MSGDTYDAEQAAAIKAKLIAKRYPTPTGMDEEDVEIDGIGTVRVRGITRIEAIWLSDIEDKVANERRTLHFALIFPRMTEPEISEWMAASEAGGDIAAVMAVVQRLSSMGPKADKEAYKSVRDDAGAGVRVLPSGEATDDSGTDASGDVAV